MAEAKSDWLEGVVRQWVIAVKESGFTLEESMAAQHYLDMEYPEDFQYPKPYMALRAFFMLAELTPGADKDDHVLASPAARILVCAEAAYRMGYDDAKKLAGKPSDEGKAAET